MYILQNIKFPHQNLSEVPSELYYRSTPEKTAFKHQDGKIYPAKNSSNSSLEFSTFFGAFSLTTWCGQAGLNDVGVSLEMEGTGTVSLWHKEEGCEPVKMQELLFDADKGHFSIHLENLQGKKGILYPRIEADSPDFVFHHGHYWTRFPPRHDAYLTIVMTTFKREENARNKHCFWQGLTSVSPPHTTFLKAMNHFKFEISSASFTLARCHLLGSWFQSPGFHQRGFLQ